MDNPVGSLLAALDFAARKHRDQRRKDLEASPYINHPITLATLLCNRAGISDPVTLMGAVLHDTVEDTETTFEELEKTFGADVCQVVREVTDDKTLPKAERKQLQILHASRLSRPAKLVKLADKIANLRDLTASPPADWTLQRRQEYFQWARAVVDEIRGTHATLEALFDATYQQGMAELAQVKQDYAMGLIPIAYTHSPPLFLLIRHNKGHWGFPKGHPEPGESALETARREFTEETGIQDYIIWQTQPLVEHYRFTEGQQQISKTVTYFLAGVESLDVKLQAAELQDYAWLPLAQALQRLTFDRSRATLLAAHRLWQQILGVPTDG